MALSVTVALSLLSYRSVTKLNSLAGMVDHTHVVQLNLQRTYGALSDADSELKSFLITKDSSYYFNLIMEEDVIRQSILKLKILTQDNISQNKGIASLENLIRTRQQYMDASMKGTESDYDLYSAKIEKCNQLIRQSIYTLNANEEELLKQRSDHSSQYQSTAPLPLLGLQIVIAFCLLVGFFLVTADLRTLERLQRETSQKNKELQEQRDFIRGIFENTVDVIVVFDRNLNIVAMNKRAKELYDPHNNLIGKNVLEAFPQAGGSESINGVREALKGRYTHNQARESLVHKGTYFESFFVPLISDQNVTGAMSIHHDVSEIIKMTSDIKAINLQLRKSNDELEQFAYVTSHDLQEPLRKIRTFSDFAKRNIDNKEVVVKNLDRLYSSAERMSILIRDILNYSRVSNGVSAKEEVDLNEVLDQVLQDFELAIEEKEAVVDSCRLPKVSGSRQQLIQVISNLISNALKFCKTTPRIKIGCRHDGEKYIITFVDNGIGFEPVFAEQIFGVFQRLHHSYEFAGTGIGLALCKRIIENHGGSIKATSTPNHGTTITLTLPDTLRNNGTLVFTGEEESTTMRDMA